MKMIRSPAIVALMTAALGLTAIAPAFAQDATTPAQIADNGHRDGGQRGDNGPRQFGRGGDGLGGLLNFQRGAEAIEIAVVRLSHAIELTPEQTTLLDDLKTAALSAQAEFAKVLAAARPAANATIRPDVTTMVKNRIAIDTAHAKALSAVLPKLEAFTASLTDTQKATLAKARGDRQNQHMGNRGAGQRDGRHNGPGRGADNTQAPMNG